MSTPRASPTRLGSFLGFVRANRQLILGGLLSAIGAALTILLAFLAGAKEPPSQATQALMVFLAIVAQGGAARVFYGRGKADPTHAKRSAARLINLAKRADDAEAFAQQLFESKASQGEMHAAIGIISTHLSYLEEGLIGAYEDWQIFHPHVPELEADSDSKPD